MILAKNQYKYEHSSSVMGVAAYHGLVCAVYSVRVSMCREVRGLADFKLILNTLYTSAFVGV